MIVYTRARFTPEAKRVAARYVVVTGCPVKQAAEELLVARSTLYRWVAEYRRDEELVGQFLSKLTPDEAQKFSDCREAIEKELFEETLDRLKKEAQSERKYPPPWKRPPPEFPYD